MGLLIVIEMARFAYSGWVVDALVEPSFHFTYEGFHWVKPFGEVGMMCVIAVIAFGGLGMMFSRWYRLCSLLCGVGLSYIFLIDKTHYLNHMYFLVWVCVLFAVVQSSRHQFGHQWMIDLARFQVAVVYVFGGIAKLNTDWIEGRPMLYWMDQRRDWAYVGEFIAWDPFAMGIAWGGIAFDLLVIPALLWRRTRWLAVVATVGFHLVNAGLFRIGIFPWLMIGLTVMFIPSEYFKTTPERSAPTFRKPWIAVVAVWMLFHLVTPLRHHGYSGDVAWTEEGHRFSWRMKLRSKVGRVVFHALDRKKGTYRLINPLDELTTIQTRKMATRPDMILQYAMHVASKFEDEGSGEWAIHVDAQASLNGSAIRQLINPEVDLSTVDSNTPSSVWITARP